MMRRKAIANRNQWQNQEEDHNIWLPVQHMDIVFQHWSFNSSLYCICNQALHYNPSWMHRPLFLFSELRRTKVHGWHSLASINWSFYWMSYRWKQKRRWRWAQMRCVSSCQTHRTWKKHLEAFCINLHCSSEQEEADMESKWPLSLGKDQRAYL